MKNQPMHPIGGGRIGTGFRPNSPVLLPVVLDQSHWMVSKPSKDLSVIDQADVNTLDKEHLGRDKNHKILDYDRPWSDVRTPDRPSAPKGIYSMTELQYRDVDRCETAPFVPIHVSFDKKVLHFKGYYTEEIVEVLFFRLLIGRMPGNATFSLVNCSL